MHEWLAEDLNFEMTPFLDAGDPCANIVVSDADEFKDQVSESVEFLADEGESLDKMRQDVAAWCLDFAYYWYESKSAYAEAKFPSEMVEIAANLGVALCVSVYPCSENQEE